MAFGERSSSRFFFSLDIFVLVSFSLMFALSSLSPSSTNVINLTGHHPLYSRSFYPVLSKLFLALLLAFHFFLPCFPALFPFFLFLPFLSFFHSPVPGYNPAAGALARPRRLKYRLGTLRYVASDPNAGSLNSLSAR